MLSTQPSLERQTFEKFLAEVKALMQKKNVKPPSGFISYAWPSEPAELKALQAWLTRLKKDFSQLGIDVFLDIENMNGNMRECMRLIHEKDFVFLIGTPRFKERAEQDALYLLPSFKPELLPTKGQAVVLTENDDMVHFMENGKVLGGERTISRRFDLSEIEWVQKPGYKRAKLSKAANSIIEEAMYQITERKITNVAYEFGLVLDKVKKFPNALMPLLYQEDFKAAFPEDILAETLIRDCRDTSSYYKTFISFSNPVGFIPALCPTLQNDEDYRLLAEEYLGWEFAAWREQKSKKPVQEELSLYIPARGDLSVECRNPKPMIDGHIQEFLSQKSAKVLLLLGGSGSGKSLFGRYLSHLILQANAPRSLQEVIPVWISLPGLRNPKTQAMKEGLGLDGVPEPHQVALKQKPLLIILDAYDEVRDLGNLYDSNHLEEWNAKIIITCRPEFLTTKNVDTLFKPKSSGLWTRYVAPFSSEEIQSYLEHYVEQQGSRWTVNEYQQHINRLPVIKELIQTPFLLRIVADVLPDIAEAYQENEQLLLTRRALYEKFIDRWFLKHIIRWKEQFLEDQSARSKLDLLDEDLALSEDEQQEWDEKRIAVLRIYAEALAHRLYSSQIDAVSLRAAYPWVKELFDRTLRPALIRSACPLKKTGEDTYSFIHKSLLEYLVTPQMVREIFPQNANPLETLNQAITPNTIQFLKDAIQERPELQAGLWAIIESSKQDESKALIASNAITVLNAARISFSGMDLQGVRIPGADLTGAILDNTSLENADLSNVILAGAWLHGTNFKNALLNNLVLGEYPSLLLRDASRSCCYSPDGKLLAVAVGITITLYDSQNRALLRVLESHTREVQSVAFSPDGQLLASASDDKTVKLWKVEDGILQRTLKAHDGIFGGATSIHFSPDGQLLASAGDDTTVKLWRISNGKLQRTLKDNRRNFVKSVVFSPDGQLLAFASNNIRDDSDNAVELWKVSNGKLERALKGHTHRVNSVAFSPDGQLLVSAGGNMVKLWKVEDGTLQRTLEGHIGAVSSIAFSPDGQLLALSSYDTTVKLWKVEDGTLQRTLEGHIGAVNSVAFSPDGQLLASSGNDKTVKLWKVEDGKLQQRVLGGHIGTVNSVVFSPDGQLLASAGNDKTVKLWAASNGKLQQVLDHTKGISSVTFSPDGQLLASAGDGIAKLWTVSNGAPEWTLKRDTVSSVAFSPDGQLLALSGFQMVELWVVLHGTLQWTFEGHPGGVSGVVFSPDGQLLASAGTTHGNPFMYHADSTVNAIRLLAVSDGVLQRVFESDAHDTINMQFSPDGQLLASGNFFGILKLWAVNGELQLELESHTNVISIAFSPDGYLLALGSLDNTIQIWQGIGSLEVCCFIINLTSAAHSLCFKQNATEIFLVSGHNDGTVKYWKLESIDQKPYLQLIWSTNQDALLCQEANLEGAQGLSTDNANLLKQRGAVGNPLALEAALQELEIRVTQLSERAAQSQESAEAAVPLIFSLAGRSAKTVKMEVDLESAQNQSQFENSNANELVLEDNQPRKKGCCVIL